MWACFFFFNPAWGGKKSSCRDNFAQLIWWHFHCMTITRTRWDQKPVHITWADSSPIRSNQPESLKTAVGTGPTTLLKKLQHQFVSNVVLLDERLTYRRFDWLFSDMWQCSISFVSFVFHSSLLSTPTLGPHQHIFALVSQCLQIQANKLYVSRQCFRTMEHGWSSNV